MSFRSFLELDARFSDQLRVAEKPGFLRNIAVLFAQKQWEVVEFCGIGGLAAVVFIIKFLVRRERPEGDWGAIYRSTDPHSFPSGHAGRAFLIALIASALSPAGWVVLVLWIWAPLVALARVAMGVHYLSDILAGALLGILVAWFGLQFYLPLHTWFVNLSGFSFW